MTAISIADIALSPFVYFGGLFARLIRRAGSHRLPHCRNSLIKAGAFPIASHYYEPQFSFNPRETARFAQVRDLPGIDWNIDGQLSLLNELTFADEIDSLETPIHGIDFSFRNRMFEEGDAEFWYQLIRLKKPRRIIEIGSGQSTIVARHAIERNKQDDSEYNCDHICIEPYESPNLEQTPATVIRERVEDVPRHVFAALEHNDILFIDSSHVIRPEGDVLLEFLQLIPTLRDGVIVHIHDIFSPRNYPTRWITERVLFWNEQYLLEAFLSHNSDWKILAALNLLQHDHHEELKAVCPRLPREKNPGSFYIQRESGNA